MSSFLAKIQVKCLSSAGKFAVPGSAVLAKAK